LYSGIPSCLRIFNLSSGLVKVLETAPAVPPVRKFFQSGKYFLFGGSDLEVMEAAKDELRGNTGNGCRFSFLIAH
jgi:hypothetical protein